MAMASVLDYWFRELAPAQWFRGGAELDPEIRRRFSGLVADARDGKLDDWAAEPRGRLALILVLDQFARHVHRGSPDTYDGDAKAQELTREGVELGMDRELAFSERHFFYMPLMHAEDAALQELSLRCFAGLRDDVEAVLGFASHHAGIVQRFGRFPHRNALLGRSSTPEEAEFIASDANIFR